MQVYLRGFLWFCVHWHSFPFQGGVIMLLGFWLFEAELIHVVSITFTALILTELLMVALTIRTWHGLMIVAELVSIVIYILSLLVLRDYFGELTAFWGAMIACLVVSYGKYDINFLLALKLAHFICMCSCVCERA